MFDSHRLVDVSVLWFVVLTYGAECWFAVCSYIYSLLVIYGLNNDIEMSYIFISWKIIGCYGFV